MQTGNNNRLRLSYSYGAKALIAVIMSAITIFIYFRGQLINNLEVISEKSYTALALTVNKTMGEILSRYHDEIKEDKHENHNYYPPQLEDAAHELVADTSVVRAKIYNRMGTVIYSTRHSQIGDNQSTNPGFISAISGVPATKLIYKDTFNFFDHESENANLAQSYVPIWDVNNNEIVGVLEIYADINELVAQTSRTQILILLVILLVMGLLYIILMYAIIKAERIIDAQHKESKERQKTLEILSGKMITAQEDEKKRISLQLHEDVVQSMTAVKIHLERYLGSARDLNDELGNAKEILPLLQDAIYKIRSVSMDLRPRSLDDFGLKAAASSLINDCQPMFHGTSIMLNINESDAENSDEIRSILFRIIKDTLQLFSAHCDYLKVITIDLDNEAENIMLKIAVSENPDKIQEAGIVSLSGDFDKMEEITILSGGRFQILSESNSKLTAQSIWAH